MDIDEDLIDFVGPNGPTSSTSRAEVEEEDGNMKEVVVREAAIEVIDRMLVKLNHSIQSVRRKRERLEEEKMRELAKQSLSKKKVPVGMYLPPYFRNEHGRGPALNEEAQRKRANQTFDSLNKELKRWTPLEIKKLNEAVMEEFILARTQSLRDKCDLLSEKIRASGVETSEDEKREWAVEKDTLERKMNYIKNDKTILSADTSCVNWSRISSKAFKGSRTPVELRLRWNNEFSPLINNKPWQKEELEKLKALVQDKVGFVNWRYVATQLNTRRSPFAVFQKYKDDIASQNTKEWTREEDERLLGVVEIVSGVNGINIQWDKVCSYMPGRTRYQCRARYMRTLDKSVRHGRWNEEEDLLLLCAVERYGNKEWHKVCKQVPGRSDVQCRDRWINVLAVTNSRAGATSNWTVEEDEKLLVGIEIFGKSRWRAIADHMLPEKRPGQIRSRFSSLITTKIRFSSAQVDQVRRTQQAALIRQIGSETKKEKVFQRFGELFGEDHQVADLRTVDYQKTADQRAMISNVTDQEREAAAVKKAEIDQRYSDPGHDGTEAALRVLDMIKVTEADAVYLERRLEKRRRLYGPRCVYRCEPANPASSNRRLRRPLHIPKDKIMLKEKAEDEEDDDADEEQREAHVTEALAQLVHLYDLYEFHTQCSTDSNIEEMKHHFENVIVEALKDSENLPLDEDVTLPPNLGTCALLSNYMKAQPELAKKAGEFFSRVEYPVGTETDPTLNRMHISLSGQVTDSEHYKRLKNHMRCMLLEPLQFNLALLTEKQESMLKGVQDKQAELKRMDESKMLSKNQIDGGKPLIVPREPPVTLPITTIDSTIEKVISTMSNEHDGPPARKKARKSAPSKSK